MALERWLLDILVCPESHKPLIYFKDENFLFSPDSRLKFKIEDDIPHLLIDEAERLDEAGAAELSQKARAAGLWPAQG